MKKVFLFTIIFALFLVTGCTAGQTLRTNTTSTPTTSPVITPTPIRWTVRDNTPYPTSSENFIETPSLSGAEAERRIKELGAGESLTALKEWYSANGIPESRQEAEVYEDSSGTFWNLSAKSLNGHYLKFTLTSGPEDGKVVRAMGLVNYLSKRPSFTTSELENPPGYENATQQMIWDKDGWSIVGLYQGEQFVGWFNADAPGDGKWEIEQVSTPEAIFVPEGFSIGEMGLLKNPDTGKDVLAMNPEADWKRFREELIGGLWEANVDWYNYTGETNDAINYTKEEFIIAALEGKEFHIGIPVRLDGKYVPDEPEDFEKYKANPVVLKMVDINMDDIQIQAIGPNAFEDYTGMDWTDDGQEAYPCFTRADRPSNVCLFGVKEKNLVISVGSFETKSNVPVAMPFLIGRFDTTLHEKYSSYFRPDGIGVQAEHAMTATLGSIVDDLSRFSLAHDRVTPNIGQKIISVGKASPIYSESFFYFTPNLFIFSP